MIRKDFDIFQMIYKESSLSKAADRLDMNQGALSRVLSRLETELNSTLFIRSNRGLRPTTDGDRLFQQIQTQLKIWDDYLSVTNKPTSDLQGLLTIGGHPSVLIQYSSAFSKLIQDNPLLNLEFTLDRSPSITRKVLNHEVDFAIVANPTLFPELVIRKLKTEEVGLYSRGTKPRPIVTYNPALISSANILAKYKKSTIQLIPASDYGFAAQLALDLKGQAILPISVAERFGLTQRIGKPFFNAQISLIFRADHRANRLLNSIIKEFSTY
ncbi:MAG: LysR family transcriptional regulator [Bdellovibrionales bacterium]|nr:LysR family transcriptional regulator [Bdellovibrionales bacterium]